MKKYNVLYVDPPWSYQNKTGRDYKHGSAEKYSVMTNEDIFNLPMLEISEKDAVCFLWATVPLMPEAFEALKIWGFKYKTMLTWRKVMSLGMGYWFRGQTEHLLLGVKGSVKAFRMQTANFHQCKTGKHSQKPHYFRELINRAVLESFDNPTKLELFARDRDDLFPDYEYEGWDLYGDQVKNSISIL